ncbi:hypothetical protein [Microbulbifer sp. JMSA003]|uniref:hypothetical protein n=1 Tax=Microbulbifer sp. JMSA003 TaxID=3243369 RepID=UPI004039B397
MKTSNTKQPLGLIGLLLAGSILATSYGVNADVSCGDTITTAEILTEDLFCESGLIIQGPSGSLNLNGYSYECNEAAIILNGKGGVLSDNASLGGNLNSCIVVAEGDGGHTITGITMTVNGSEGVVFVSDNNTLSNSTVNVVSGPYAVIIAGANGSIVSNLIQAENNIVTGDGILLGDDADNTVLFFNTVTDFAFNGMQICSDNNLIAQNIVEGNGSIVNTFGIELPYLESPCSNSNLEGQSGNVIVGNVATYNNTADLADFNPEPCLNTWVGNTADVVEGACIDP